MFHPLQVTQNKVETFWLALQLNQSSSLKALALTMHQLAPNLAKVV